MLKSIELLTNAEVAEADRLTIAGGTPASFLMEQAGAAVASEAARLAARHGRIAVFAGRATMAAMASSPRACSRAKALLLTLGCFGTREGLRGDAALTTHDWNSAVHAIEDIDLDAADLAIDALLGAGLARALDGLAKAAVLRLNAWTLQTKRPILAVDVPPHR